jgi:GNAT superfamily N-acetyltransferase
MISGGSEGEVMSCAEITVRHDLRPGDLGRVVELHGVVYATEFGLDHSFEAYAAETVADVGRQWRPERDRLWLAEMDGRLVGCVGILGRDDDAAQLRWFLVDPSLRGRGLGRHLLNDAIAFCRAADYKSIFLWTADFCVDAARLYLAAGFRRSEVKPPGTIGSKLVVEERYDLALLM